MTLLAVAMSNGCSVVGAPGAEVAVGVEVGVGEAYPGQWLAINPGQVSAALPGTPTQDPAFGLPAIWIDTNLREQAQVYGYTVVDSSTVVATHLNHLVVTHASELLGRREVQALRRSGLTHPGCAAERLALSEPAL